MDAVSHAKLADAVPVFVNIQADSNYSISCGRIRYLAGSNFL
jgi:hypothetical protein